jgi:regulator of sigma E protease
MQQVLSAANSTVAVIVVIGLCLFCHELGHFLAAKLCRMRVYEFAMGLGPLLWRWRRGETEYSLRLIPFGGFVRIAGMEPGEGPVEGGFHSRPRWQGLIVVCAGTLMNVVLALVLYWGINVFSGVADPNDSGVLIRDVFADRPAARAGLRPGDKVVQVGLSRLSPTVQSVVPGSLGDRMGLKPGYRIVQVGDEPIATPEEFVEILRKGVPPGTKIWAAYVKDGPLGPQDEIAQLRPPAPGELASLLAPNQRLTDPTVERVLGVQFAPLDQGAVHSYISGNPGRPVILTVLRGDSLVKVVLTPQQDFDRVGVVRADGQLAAPHRAVGRIGVVLGPQLRRTGVIEGFTLAVQQAKTAVLTVLMALRDMMARKVAPELSGPVGIMATTAETAKLGWAAVLGLCALISANLSVVNMFPIPPFDGFHVVLLGIEAVRRRRVDHRLEMLVRLAGFVLVVCLFLVLTYRDLLNLFRYGTN